MVFTAEGCVLVSKKEKEGKDGNKYYSIGICQNRQDIKDFGVTLKVYNSVPESLFYKPITLTLEYVETKDYGSFLRIIEVVPFSGK